MFERKESANRKIHLQLHASAISPYNIFFGNVGITASNRLAVACLNNSSPLKDLKVGNNCLEQNKESGTRSGTKCAPAIVLYQKGFESLLFWHQSTRYSFLVSTHLPHPKPKKKKRRPLDRSHRQCPLGKVGQLTAQGRNEVVAKAWKHMFPFTRSPKCWVVVSFCRWG